MDEAVDAGRARNWATSGNSDAGNEPRGIDGGRAGDCARKSNSTRKRRGPRPTEHPHLHGGRGQLVHGGIGRIDDLR